MARLVYSALLSLDGYTSDKDGRFDWLRPDEEMSAFINDLVRSEGTYLLGRRMYEVMSVWETWPADDDSKASLDFAESWRAADKVVYSKTLKEVSTSKTRLERDFDPVAVERMKSSARRDLSISGPTLAAHAFRAGLIDDVHLFVTPIVLGGGLRALPSDVHLDLALKDERRFRNGVIYLHYQAQKG